MDILGMGYLGFESPNPKAWLEYGPEVLGFGLGNQRSDDETAYLRMDDRAWRLAFHPGETDRLAYIGWELRNRPAFLAAIKKLEANGFEVAVGDGDLEKQRGVHGVASFTDPVGYHHELYYGQEFHPNSFVPGRNHAGFVAEELGVGHVVLVVPEVPEDWDHFIFDVMEFGWFGHGMIRMPGGFYRAKHNPRSHNIAYLAMPGHFGIHHIGIETKELDDVGVAYDLYEEREIPLQMTLGRHTQDPVISFYGVTPSGFFVEYLTEGIILDDDHMLEAKPEQLSVWGHKLVGPQLPPTVQPVG
jgi:2,3-dihydroxybiphenyl 1,2-dioxygenase